MVVVCDLVLCPRNHQLVIMNIVITVAHFYSYVLFASINAMLRGIGRKGMQGMLGLPGSVSVVWV